MFKDYNKASPIIYLSLLAEFYCSCLSWKVNVDKPFKFLIRGQVILCLTI